MSKHRKSAKKVRGRRRAQLVGKDADFPRRECLRRLLMFCRKGPSRLCGVKQLYDHRGDGLEKKGGKRHGEHRVAGKILSGQHRAGGNVPHAGVEGH